MCIACGLCQTHKTNVSAFMIFVNNTREKFTKQSLFSLWSKGWMQPPEGNLQFLSKTKPEVGWRVEVLAVLDHVMTRRKLPPSGIIS